MDQNPETQSPLDYNDFKNNNLLEKFAEVFEIF